MQATTEGGEGRNSPHRASIQRLFVISLPEIASECHEKSTKTTKTGRLVDFLTSGETVPPWSTASTLLGSDEWSNHSADTFTRNPDASQLVTVDWSGETSGRDTYDDAESLTWVAVTPLGDNSSSANGSSTSNGSGVTVGSQLISLSSVSSDRGWDGYRFTGSGVNDTDCEF